MSSAIEMSPATTRALRITGWSFAAGLLALPAIAMQFTDEVNWSGSDFVFAAIMFGTVGGLLDALDAGNVGLAAEIASIPEHIRGYGHVKDAHLEKAKAREAELLKEWANPLRVVRVA